MEDWFEDVFPVYSQDMFLVFLFAYESRNAGAYFWEQHEDRD
jgi:hypothetical protein